MIGIYILLAILIVLVILLGVYVVIKFKNKNNNINNIDNSEDIKLIKDKLNNDKSGLYQTWNNTELANESIKLVKEELDNKKYGLSAIQKDVEVETKIVEDIKQIINSETSGNVITKTVIDDILTKVKTLVDSDYGLNIIKNDLSNNKTTIDAIKTILNDGTSGLDAIKNIIEIIKESSDKLNDTDNGLGAINTNLKTVVNNTGISFKAIEEFNRITSKDMTYSKFGELNLDRMLSTFSNDIYVKQYTMKKGNANGNNYRVDAFINGGKKYNNIAIDAKFPYKDYLKILDKDDKIDLTKLSGFKSGIKTHINKVAEYISDADGVIFAVMYIPSDAIWELINNECEGLETYAYDRKVIIASPRSLYPIIWTIDKARTIQDDILNFDNKLANLNRIQLISGHMEESLKDIVTKMETFIKLYRRGIVNNRLSFKTILEDLGND
ncbi:DNA recombination protein RmuC [Spiroplasma attinicola]|uniref:DNA recombination protein RmuC n=1 Tax=Spiroplasma attinicola TaxID=2904537 RepID=UPI0020229FFC|nr:MULTISPECIES: DNA recombination protein RmuC [unclassified Spiroplasma]MCL8210009.1 hypothetical protein [Spiroplasma sp. JKS002670]MCL8210960.1 hypothetical protein [Spiroplasma sp. JKS002671]